MINIYMGKNMELTRENILKIAEQAGYGIQHTGIPEDDGIHCNKWVKEIWGGWFETQKVIKFANLIAQECDNGLHR